MLYTSTTTRLDKMGRIVIPKEIRRVNGWQTDDLLVIESDCKGTATIRAVTPRCCVCGSDRDLMAVKDKFICQECFSEL